ncbi:MAG TPA: hypothetical protein VI818_06600 [Candidatus Thermoplasmatota archaeon]|nr:hypothetical protein [Candidatus Thermoplasmatota archaeon]
MRAPVAFLAALMIVAALSGCFAADPAADAHDHDEAGDNHEDANETADAGNQTVPENVTVAAPVANLTADVLNGTAPLVVNFTLANDGGNLSAWVLSYGEGNATNGTELGVVAFTFVAAGAYNATLMLEGPGGNSSATLSITVSATEAPQIPPPSKVKFNSGPVTGCVSEAGYKNCPAYVRGPANSQYLGLWITLEPGHVGMNFATTSFGGDSDGWIFTSATGDSIKDVSNSGGEAKGVVPPGAKYILIVSWATPSDDLEVVFTPAV